MALKDCILLARERLVSYPVCHVFHILDWLLINQWSHPTLVAMMRGEDVDRESGIVIEILMAVSMLLINALFKPHVLFA